MLPYVAIVILNWKRPQETVECLRSVARLDYPAYEVILVDNGSANGSLEAIRGEFPAARIIENKRNLGFAGGCNVGIRRALHDGAAYVLLLNDDTEVAPDLLRRLVLAAESDPHIGMLGPTIYYHQPADVIWSAGGVLGKYGNPSHRDVTAIDQYSDDVQEVDYMTGCALLVKRGVIERVGAFDERFFAYFEETEWCTRARHAGFRIVYVPHAHMWHKVEPNARGTSQMYLYLMARNRLLYLKCSGASPRTIGVAIADLLRTALSWSLRSRHRAMRPYSGALIRGVQHFLVGRFGAPPANLV